MENAVFESLKKVQESKSWGRCLDSVLCPGCGFVASYYGGRKCPKCAHNGDWVLPYGKSGWSYYFKMGKWPMDIAAHLHTTMAANFGGQAFQGKTFIIPKGNARFNGLHLKDIVKRNLGIPCCDVFSIHLPILSFKADVQTCYSRRHLEYYRTKGYRLGDLGYLTGGFWINREKGNFCFCSGRLKNWENIPE